MANTNKINEMQISKGYWIWGLFPSKETDLLNKIKVKVQSKLKSPDFETHLTLAGPYLTIDEKFLKKLKIICEINSILYLFVEGYDFSQETFKSFYISIKNSKRLKEIRKNIYEFKKFDFEKEYYPHISLSYGRHEIQEKKELISKLPDFNEPIRMSKIVLVEVEEDINRWQILRSFDLNKITLP